jgi:hypothetical protein
VMAIPPVVRRDRHDRTGCCAAAASIGTRFASRRQQDRSWRIWSPRTDTHVLPLDVGALCRAVLDSVARTTADAGRQRWWNWADQATSAGLPPRLCPDTTARSGIGRHPVYDRPVHQNPPVLPVCPELLPPPISSLDR